MESYISHGSLHQMDTSSRETLLQQCFFSFLDIQLLPIRKETLLLPQTREKTQETGKKSTWFLLENSGDSETHFSFPCFQFLHFSCFVFYSNFYLHFIYINLHSQ
ncbi:hypothetical protein I3843_09G151200 [Carya illinoinensis]|uniref:Uncharacterized protein n=1 Tax=Carya illinoinensis TaxID=32201 RepID=A0A922E6D6_CARIL|nr:hypothetical protein I3842_09G155900 [Carya illinoinensis]KAG7964098.1 hypothetical protein I3843_09G151200 [Carya illinoinensis]